MTKLYKTEPSPFIVDKGKFVVRAALPGLVVPNHNDHGYGALAAVAESHMAPDTLIGMHPHVQDEIISYVPDGVMRHDDRTHGKLVTDAEHLLVMNAGTEFWHEELTLASDPPLRMLQIFVRPYATDLEPKLQHGKLPASHANEWRHIVGPEGGNAPFFVRNDVHLHDIRLSTGAVVTLPNLPEWDTFFFIYSGLVEVEGQRFAASETGLAIQPDHLAITAVKPSVLVAFVINPTATITRQGSVGDSPTLRALGRRVFDA